MILAVWLLSLPFRALAALGLRRSIVLACLFVLAVTAYSVAEDLGLLDPPAQAAPAHKPAAGQPQPSRTATADIPAGYLRTYQAAAGRCPGLSWTVLAGIGKVESDHGRAPPARGPLGLERRRRRRADAVRHRSRPGRQRLGHLRPRRRR
jgi:hypothetical protein